MQWWENSPPNNMPQGAVSRKSRNFMGHFRGSQFLLQLKNGEHLICQTSQLIFFLLPWKHVKRSAFQNKWLAISQMAFWAWKGFGTFEKQAPGLIPGTDTISGLSLCWFSALQTRVFLRVFWFYSLSKTSIQPIPVGCKLCSRFLHGPYSGSQRSHSRLSIRPC